MANNIVFFPHGAIGSEDHVSFKDDLEALVRKYSVFKVTVIVHGEGGGLLLTPNVYSTFEAVGVLEMAKAELIKTK